MLPLLLKNGFCGAQTQQPSHTLRKRNMRIHESFVQPETDAPMLSRASMTGWRKSLTTITLLASATGIGWAQPDDVLLPSPILPVQVSTSPSNGDGNPY